MESPAAPTPPGSASNDSPAHSGHEGEAAANFGMPPSLQTLYPVSLPGGTAGFPPPQALSTMLAPMAQMGMPGAGAPFMMSPFQLGLHAQGMVPSPAHTGPVQSRGSPAPLTPGSNSLGSPQMIADASSSRSGTPAQQMGLSTEQHMAAMQAHLLAQQQQQQLQQQQQQQQQKLQQQQQQMKQQDSAIANLKPPKKPLTPYMRFSKSIWPSVKAQHMNLSVCEIGATIGRMWRELKDDEKQKHNDDFTQAKVQYEEELQHYLKITGLQASDLVKPRNKKKDKDAKTAAAHKARAPVQPQQPIFRPQMTMAGMQMPFQGNLAGAGSLPMVFAANSAEQQQVTNALSGALPHFSQVWASGQGNPMIVAAPQTGAAGNMGVAYLHIQPPGGGGGDAVQFSPGQQVATSNAQPTSEAATWLWPQLLQQQQQQYNAAAGFDVIQQAMQQTMQQGQAAVASPGGTASPQNGVDQTADAMAPHDGHKRATPVESRTADDGNSHDSSGAGRELPAQSHETVAGTGQNGNNTDISMFPSSCDAAAPSVDAPLKNGPVDSLQRPPSFGLPVPNQPSTTAPSFPSAHNQYNSYAYNPWSVYPGDSQGNSGAAPAGAKPVFRKENILESELQHLRSALSEKTKEVQRLTQELEKAYDIIEGLRQGHHQQNSV